MSALNAASVTQKGLAQEFARIISSWTVPIITKHCQECGVATSGRKAEVALRLADALLEPALPTPFNLVSLDIGILNFAKAIIRVDEGKPKLLEWNKSCLHLPAVYNPRSNALLLKDFANSLVASQEGTSVYLIERQTFRGGGLRMIPGTILNVNRIEVQLHCFLLEQNVVSINAQSISSMYDLHSSPNKKKQAVNFVDKLISLEKPPIDFPKGLASYFRTEKKKDDLADALLQGLAYLSWRNNLGQLRHNLLSKLGNRV